MKVTIFFDGGCRNHVCAAGAAVAYDEDGNELGRMAHFREGEDCTNNIAEYYGLIVAFNLAADIEATDILILGDSELIIRQFNKQYQCRKEHLKPLLITVQDLAIYYNSCIVQELPKAGKNNKRRYGNDVADALATECMNLGKDIHVIAK
jgi:ribonuclease HI